VTVRELINGSLRLLGVLASGEDCSASEAADSLAALDAMLNSWSTERLSVMSTTERNVILTASKNTYTIGAGGDIDIPRPAQIYDVSAVYPSGPGETYISLDEITLDEYSAYAYIAYETPIPQSFYLNPGFPFTNISFVGRPQAGTKIRFWTWDELSQYTSVNAVLALAPGYERALRYCLAVELAPEFGKEPSAAVVQTAETAKTNIQRMNAQDLVLFCDPALQSWKTGSFNRLLGTVG
jgi:hypothetical protein